MKSMKINGHCQLYQVLLPLSEGNIVSFSESMCGDGKEGKDLV